MQQRRTKAFHEFGGPLGAPSHQLLPWCKKPKPPFCGYPAFHVESGVISSHYCCAHVMMMILHQV
jgi:hypothetical protein